LREDNSDDLLAIVLHSPVALPAVALALMVNGIGTPLGTATYLGVVVLSGNR